MSIADDINLIQRWIGANPTGNLNDPNTVAELLKDVVGLQDYLNKRKGTISPPIETEDDWREIDQRSATVIESLIPAVQIEFKRLWQVGTEVASRYGCVYKFISGNRTYEEQNRLYDQGRTSPGNRVTNAKGGYSNHNFGVAADGGIFKNGKYLEDSISRNDKALADQIQREIAVEVKSRRLKLDWGGDWRTFKDIPHWEYKTGLTTQQKRSRIAKGQSIV